MHAYKSNTVF